MDHLWLSSGRRRAKEARPLAAGSRTFRGLWYTAVRDVRTSGKTPTVVITHKDRLLRFGAELVFAICEAKHVEVVILNQGEDTTFEDDLAKDVLEIITVFSARLYGSRSRENQKLLDGVKAAVEASQC